MGKVGWWGGVVWSVEEVVVVGWGWGGGGGGGVFAYYFLYMEDLIWLGQSCDRLF